MQHHATTCSFTTAESWVILSPIEQSIKRKIEAVGTPLKDWDIQIYRGVLTGYNEAFIISSQKREEILSACKSEEEKKRTAAIIRPILRGRDIKRYGYEWAEIYLIATFPSRHYDIEEYPALKAYLLTFGKERLEQTGKTYTIDGQTIKARKKTNNKWFEVQDSISYWNDFSQQKIVWGNLNLKASYALVCNDYFINAPATFLVPASSFLLATLNSKLADFYIRRQGVSRNGGYFEYKPMFVEKLPVPQRVSTRLINEIEETLTKSDKASIDNIIYSIYGLSPDEIAFIEKSSQ